MLVNLFLAVLALVFLFICCYYYYYVHIPVPPKSRVCLVGKTAIITGANRGIGFEVTLQLAMRGCRVIMACRSNLEEARQEVIRQTKNPNVIARYIDLSSFHSVKKFAKEIVETEDKLDILIHNAVLVGIPLKHTEDGLNPVMEINYFSPVLLTHLLSDLLKKSAPSRVIFVSSLLSFCHHLTLENLNYPETPLTKLTSLLLYNNCKLCQIIAATEFGERLKNSGVAVNAVHPGLVNTSIFRQMKAMGSYDITVKLVYALIIAPLARSPVEGTYAIMEAATSDRYANTNGKLIYDRGVLFLPPALKNKKFCKEIWKATEDFIKLAPSERL